MFSDKNNDNEEELVPDCRTSDTNWDGTLKKKKRKWPRWVLLGFLILLALVSLTCIGGTIYFSSQARKVDLEELKKLPERTLVYDRKGKIMGHMAGHGENRLIISIDQVSDHFMQALLAREDQRFYKHSGVDYWGVFRAVITNIQKGGFDQGASTLTMQLARNAFGFREKSLKRKALEIAVARRIERNFSKEEILAFYVNRIYFGSGLYGVEKASQGFFMKPAKELSLAESAMLVGVIRGPSVLNPFSSLENATATRDEVLNRMVTDEVISATDAEAARQEEVKLRPPDKRFASNSHVLQKVHEVLSDFLTPEEIEKGGFRIYTTIDSDLQSAAQLSLDKHLTTIEKRKGFRHPPRSAHKPEEGTVTSTKYVQGAVISIDNATGGILSMVGGRDFGDSPFNRATDAKRQAGSTFKPFVYAVAFDRGGLLPGAYISDDEIRMNGGNGKIWSPSNSDGKFTGLQPAAIGLIKSRNTMSIRVGNVAGLSNVQMLAKSLYFGEIPASPVSYLGAFETTLSTITSAYSTFAAEGINRSPFLIQKIENVTGEVLHEAEIRSTRIFRPSVAWLTSDILGLAMDEGTGKSARSAGYKAPAYGKTGTTNDYRDAWFVGFTDKVTTGVWVGMDRPQTIMSRGYGSTLALPVWTEVMKKAETAGYKAAKLPQPTATQDAVICRECGGIANRKTVHAYQMPVPTDLAPRHGCVGHRAFLTGRPQAPTSAFSDNGGDLINGNRPRNPSQPAALSGVGEKLRNFGRWLFGPNDGR